MIRRYRSDQTCRRPGGSAPSGSSSSVGAGPGTSGSSSVRRDRGGRKPPGGHGDQLVIRLGRLLRRLPLERFGCAGVGGSAAADVHPVHEVSGPGAVISGGTGVPSSCGYRPRPMVGGYPTPR